jgi:hypothetical protein
MIEDRFEIGVIVARRVLKGGWTSHQWLPVAALPAAPAAAAWTKLSGGPEEETYFAGSAEVRMYVAETSHYRDNLTSGAPSLWVALRGLDETTPELAAVTADPYEGEAMGEGFEEIVEAVPMPLEIQARVLAFVEAFHVERRFEKRKRDRADPEALASRPRGGPDGRRR